MHGFSSQYLAVSKSMVAMILLLAGTDKLMISALLFAFIELSFWYMQYRLVLNI
jgi:hypothetical protein